MSERPRQSTLLSPQGLPSSFNFSNFIIGLNRLDMRLGETLQRIKKAMEANNENEIARLALRKKKQEEAVIIYLMQAFVDTNGKIAEIPEFDPRSDRCIKLALEDDGQLLWFKIKDRVQNVAEEQRERIEELLPER